MRMPPVMRVYGDVRAGAAMDRNQNQAKQAWKSEKWTGKGRPPGYHDGGAAFGRLWGLAGIGAIFLGSLIHGP